MSSSTTGYPAGTVYSYFAHKLSQKFSEINPLTKQNFLIKVTRLSPQTPQTTLAQLTLTLVFVPSYKLITVLTITSGIPLFLIANPISSSGSYQMSSPGQRSTYTTSSPCL